MTISLASGLAREHRELPKDLSRGHFERWQSLPCSTRVLYAISAVLFSTSIGEGLVSMQTSGLPGLIMALTALFTAIGTFWLGNRRLTIFEQNQRPLAAQERARTRHVIEERDKQIAKLEGKLLVTELSLKRLTERFTYLDDKVDDFERHHNTAAKVIDGLEQAFRKNGISDPEAMALLAAWHTSTPPIRHKNE